MTVGNEVIIINIIGYVMPYLGWDLLLISDDREVKFDDCHTISFNVILSDAVIFKYLSGKYT
jgi:hypothetical protein